MKRRNTKDARDPGSRMPSFKPNVARAMRGRIPKVFNFSALRGQNETANVDSQSELVIFCRLPRPRHFINLLAPCLQQTRIRNYRDAIGEAQSEGFQGISSDSVISAQPK